MPGRKSPANLLREQIGDVGFQFYVRFWKDGSRWVGPVYGSQQRCDVLATRLRELGYEPKMTGDTGTAGQWIIEL